jgi:hypothetical protein
VKKFYFKAIIAILAVIVSSLIFAGCEKDVGDTLWESSKQLAENQSVLEANQPAPTMTYSLERQNQIERAKRINDPNKIGYVYELSVDGKVINYYVIKGKVSSTNSYLVPDEVVVYSGGATVQAPDIDGSYGDNQNAIYFFDTDGSMHEWKGLYEYSESPLKITTALTLIKEVP